jgi:proline iminopeptidase
MTERADGARIEEAWFADVDGVPQWVTMRGADARNPAVLIVGGPGLGYAALAPFFASWEHAFTLVQWDQPGAGFTFGRNGDEAPLTIDRLVRDGLRVAELARARLDGRRIALLCFSGGTIVGLHMAKRRPESFSVYVGSGQVVDWRRQDEQSYALLLDRAAALGDAAMFAELRQIGPPPYPDTATDARKSQYAGAPTERERPALGELMAAIAAARRDEPRDASYLAHGVAWPEPRERALNAYSALRGEIVAFDARRLGPEFRVPVVFLQGGEDLFTVTAEVERYASELAAPRVEFVRIEGGGHSAMLLRAELLEMLERHVRPLAAGHEA